MILKNPGPVQNENTQARITLPSHLLLENATITFIIRDHSMLVLQVIVFLELLYGDPSHHLDIRAAGIAYMRENPERFIESNTDYSWKQYLNSMSMQGMVSLYKLLQTNLILKLLLLSQMNILSSSI